MNHNKRFVNLVGLVDTCNTYHEQTKFTEKPIGLQMYMDIEGKKCKGILFLFMFLVLFKQSFSTCIHCRVHVFSPFYNE